MGFWSYLGNSVTHKKYVLFKTIDSDKAKHSIDGD